MRALALSLVLLVAAAAARGDDDPEPPGGSSGLGKLRGTWTVTKLMLKGKEMTAPRSMTYTFEGAKLTTTIGTTKRTMKVKVNTAKTPHTIELTPEGGQAAREGIFKVDGDELRIALPTAGKGVKGATPTTFDGTTGSVLILTREKK